MSVKLKEINREYLVLRESLARIRGYGSPLWIQLCDMLLDLEINIKMRESSEYKYFYLYKDNFRYTIKLLNNKYTKIDKDHIDFDFVVGYTSKGIFNIHNAFDAVRKLI